MCHSRETAQHQHFRLKPSAFIIISYYPMPFACAFHRNGAENREVTSSSSPPPSSSAFFALVYDRTAWLLSHVSPLHCWDCALITEKICSPFAGCKCSLMLLSVRNSFGGRKWWMICKPYVYDWDDLKIKMIYVAWYAISIYITYLRYV